MLFDLFVTMFVLEGLLYCHDAYWGNFFRGTACVRPLPLNSLSVSSVIDLSVCALEVLAMSTLTSFEVNWKLIGKGFTDFTD